MSEAPSPSPRRTPAWFIPVIGNLVVPLAGTAHAPVDISWFFFGGGLLYWLALTPADPCRVILAGDFPIGCSHPGHPDRPTSGARRWTRSGESCCSPRSSRCHCWQPGFADRLGPRSPSRVSRVSI